MSVYSNPYSGDIPTRAQDNTKDASRVPAHSETAKNKLEPVNNKQTNGKMGKLGIKGDGQQM